MSLVDKMLSGNERALSRLMTLVENSEKARIEVTKKIHSFTGKAQIIGFTGPPGVGKSTLVNAVATELLQRGKKVGVVAIDPSSPFSKGAILGDRIRMLGHEDNRNLFIRSLASRGKLGGLSQATNDVVKLMDAFGKDVILVETVGIGQSEYDIARTAHTTTIVLSPGYGDDIQAMKAGILEVGDVFVVNKADMDGALRTLGDLKGMIDMNYFDQSWQPTALRTTAKDGAGVSELVDQLLEHYNYIVANDEWKKLEQIRVEKELENELLGWVENVLIKELFTEMEKEKYIEQIINREADPATIIELFLKQSQLTFFSK